MSLLSVGKQGQQWTVWWVGDLVGEGPVVVCRCVLTQGFTGRGVRYIRVGFMLWQRMIGGRLAQRLWDSRGRSGQCGGWVILWVRG